MCRDQGIRLNYIVECADNGIAALTRKAGTQTRPVFWSSLCGA